MNDPAQQPQGQPQFQQPMPQQFPPGPPMYPPPYPPPQKGKGGVVALIIVGVVVGVIGLGGLLVGVLAVAVIPKLTVAKNKLETKQLAELHTGLNNVAADETKKRTLIAPQISETEGEALWMQILQRQMLEPQLAKKLVSLNSKTDSPLPPGQVSTATSTSGHCSYTLPAARELLVAMAAKGNKRCVLVTFNSRNWNNYPGQGVPCVWSDSDAVTWMTFDEASSDWGITEAEWADPRSKLFGKKAPFQYTRE